jgi:hypothetical protein
MRTAIRRAHARMKRQSRRLWRGDDPFSSDPGLDFAPLEAPAVEDRAPRSSTMRVRVARPPSVRQILADHREATKAEKRSPRVYLLAAVLVAFVVALGLALTSR